MRAEEQIAERTGMMGMIQMTQMTAIKRTDKSLLEQMQISDVEILRRMELLELKQSELEILANLKFFIEENVDPIVEAFYAKQTEIDEISLLIGDADTLARLRAAQRKYVIDLFSGSYDSEYVNNRLRIGLVHKRIGVEPKLYLSAIKTLKEIISQVLRKHLDISERLTATLNALDKLLYFDTTLVFDTYIDSLVGEIETEKRRTELYARSLEDKVAERTRQLEEQTKLDPLTNIYNRRAMEDILNREISMVKRRDTSMSLIYFDVDNFKEINDKYGHLKGDEVLKIVGECLRKCIRETDVPCRYGGDEFCILLPDCNIEMAMKVCEKLMNDFGRRCPDFYLSMGIAETGNGEYIDSDELIKRADEKMYQAKQEGGFQVRC